MATTRMRRASANPPVYAVDEDGDRLYTEEDYAEKEPIPDEWEKSSAYPAVAWTSESFLPDESFQPDEERFPDVQWQPEDQLEVYASETFTPMFDTFTADAEDDLLLDGDPLDDDLLTDAERAELRRSHWQLISGLMDFAGVILGAAAILVLVTLLVSLLNWLINDVNQSFILLQKHL